jgi:large subunit ribosomal protein L28
MSRRCQVTGKGVLSGNNVSHANNKTRTRFYPNLQSKRIWLPEEKRFVRVKLSARALRTLDKQGNGEMLSQIRKMFA